MKLSQILLATTIAATAATTFAAEVQTPSQQSEQVVAQDQTTTQDQATSETPASEVATSEAAAQ